MRVIRVLEYIGSEAWIKATIEKNQVRDGRPLVTKKGLVQELAMKFLADDETYVKTGD